MVRGMDRQLLYWTAVIGAGVLVLLDIVGVSDNEAEWTNIGAFVLIIAAIFLRPGGLFKRV